MYCDCNMLLRFGIINALLMCVNAMNAGVGSHASIVMAQDAAARDALYAQAIGTITSSEIPGDPTAAEKNNFKHVIKIVLGVTCNKVLAPAI